LLQYPDPHTLPTMTTPTFRFSAPLCAAALCIIVNSAGAQQKIDISKLQAEAVQRTREYLRINTTNPPGN
jgi:hypothetical protein